MPDRQKARVGLDRSVGLISLTLIGAGGILGSGWLFSPLLTAQIAGPASLISWVIGAVAMLLLALSFAEISSVLPVAGGVGRIPRFTHGDVTAAVIGWTAWVGYGLAAPLETSIMMHYAAQTWPALIADGQAEILSATGYLVGAILLLVCVLINLMGAAAFARANSLITVLKFALPLLIAVTLFGAHFDTANFSRTAGFAPFGWHGILSAVSTGGVVFSLLGFRYVIDMAGETENPKRNVPLALIFGLLLPLGIYLAIQVVFIGALPATELQNGWAGIEASHALGPLASLSMTFGLTWLTAVIYGSALIGPAGGALVSTGANARLAYALARNKLLPPSFRRLSGHGIPVNALILNFVFGFVMMVALSFPQLVAVCSASIVLSLSIGPVAMLALRRQFPDSPNRFRLPAPRVIASLGFVVAALIVYWSSWASVQVLLLVVVTALIYFVIGRVWFDDMPLSDSDAREALWLLPYMGSLALVSWLGNYGGTGRIPEGWDILLLTAAALLTFWFANWCAFDTDKARRYSDAEQNS